MIILTALIFHRPQRSRIWSARRSDLNRVWALQRFSARGRRWLFLWPRMGPCGHDQQARHRRSRLCFRCCHCRERIEPQCEQAAAAEIEAGKTRDWTRWASFITYLFNRSRVIIGTCYSCIYLLLSSNLISQEIVCAILRRALMTF